MTEDDRLASTIDTGHLRALAEAATPGPWDQPAGKRWRVYAGDSLVAVANGVTHAAGEVNGDYIAAAHTQAVLALLDEREDLRSAVIALCRPWAVTYSKMMGFPQHHIAAGHYDLLAKCGARMDDFVRHEGLEP